MSTDSGFGELALLYSAPRAATVRAETACSLWVMERQVYAAIKRTFTSQLAAEKRALLDRVPMLHALSQVGAQPHCNLYPIPYTLFHASVSDTE